jgi:hypothetical protein
MLAAAMTAIAGLGGLVTQEAMLFQVQRSIQASTNLAALAAAQDINCCSSTPGKAKTTATSYTALNPVGGQTVCAIAISLSRRWVCSGCQRAPKYPAERGAQCGRVPGASSRKRCNRPWRGHTEQIGWAPPRGSPGQSHLSCRVACGLRHLSRPFLQGGDLFGEKILGATKPRHENKMCRMKVASSKTMAKALDGGTGI